VKFNLTFPFLYVTFSCLAGCLTIILGFPRAFPLS
jgi:hypothetical protein